MTSNSHWQPGDQVLLRYLRNTLGDLIAPVTVVQDGDDVVALCLAVGTRLKGQAMRDGTRITREMPFVERERLIGGFAGFTWTDNHVLMLQRPDRLSSIWLLWREQSWELAGYYGNIQAPLARTHLGFDTADYLLDVSIAPDLDWRWKDEDEWELARDHSLIERGLIDEIRREGERIIADVENRAWPFNAGFETWRPDPTWPIPELPANWDEGLLFPE